MKTNRTELVFILDKSGSMGGLEADTIGGYNAMLARQQAEEGEARITTALFDNDYELLHDRLDIRSVAPITEKEYVVGGSTALLDAIGRTIHKIANVQKNTSEAYRADKVLFVITTDGMENASREYSSAQIKGLIERQQTKFGWEFIFLGANIDSVQVAGRFGIAASRVQNYHADREGTRLNYEVVADAVTHFRKSGALADNWGEGIRQDYESRGGRRVR
ncbi:vWA domain-containing protein [Cohnella fermenti]|uniref:VWA domain-containing protein n=1 Tax=Cohnella fermenti TaxID=2565925 RepID=A0A4V3WGJ1_9BACL|nr:vWA domain-containing protein [Cohnella fermenti]THF84506.1 VWA domain-containing protein [Cohnella fermenti]